MKTVIHLLTIPMVLVALTFNNALCQNQGTTSAEEPIVVYYSSDLSEFASAWFTQYNSENPAQNTALKLINNNESYERLINENAIGIVSKRHLETSNNQNNSQYVIAREVVVAIYNKNNPLHKNIEVNGVSPKNLSVEMNKTTNASWAFLCPEGESTPLHLYAVNSNTVTQNFSELVQTASEDIKIDKTQNTQELLSKIEHDIYAVGLCRLSDLEKNNLLLNNPNVLLLPFDKNNSGKLDYVEQIYTNLETLSRGVWIGKYPTELVTKIYAVAPAHVTQKAQQTVLDWMASSGQTHLSTLGYSQLLAQETKALFAETEQPIVENTSNYGNYSLLKIFLIIIGGLLFFGLLTDTIFAYQSRKNIGKTLSQYSNTTGFNAGQNIPEGVFFDKTHTWAFLEKNGTVTVGLDNFITSITGQITGVKLTDTGNKVSKGDYMVTLQQQGKQLNIKAPITGTIIEINPELKASPGLLNESAYELGWVYKIKPANWLRETQIMFMADAFKNRLKTEQLRVKDFFATVQPIAGMPVLQDGGELNTAPLQNQSPKVWEDFQVSFIDTI